MPAPEATRRWRWRAGLAPLVLAAVVVGWPVGASAGLPNKREGLVRIIQPERGTGVFPAGARVVLAVRAGTPVRVRIAGRDVTGALRLRRRDRTRLTGTVPRRFARRVPRKLEVIARRGRRIDIDQTTVQAVRPDRRFVSIGLRRARAGGAPLDALVRTRAARVDVRVGLNGHRIEGRAYWPRLRQRRIRLTRTEGLRYGRNMLRVVAHDGRGRGEVERRVFRVRRRGPIPGVRTVRRARVRALVKLDAGATLRSRRGSRLSYRWRLVRRPRGSHARIRQVRARRASYRPDRPGRYVARLSLTERAGAARASDLGTALNVALEAQPPIPPYGIPLSSDPASALTVGGVEYPVGVRNSILAVLIDRGTGVATASQVITPGQQGRDLDTLVSYLLANQDPTKIVVLVAPPADTNFSYLPAKSERYFDFLGALDLVGVDDASGVASVLANGGAFSLVAVPGSAPGTAAANGFAGPNSGLLSGYLRMTGVTSNLTGALLFEQPSFRRFALGGADGVATVTGDDPSPGDTPTQPLDVAAPEGAMSVTVLDAVTLDRVTSAVSSEGAEGRALTPITSVLSQYGNDPSKLIMFKMRAPQAWENTRLDMSPISKLLASLGANRDIFARSLQYPEGSDPPYYNPASPAPPGGPGSNSTPYGADYVFFGGAGVSPVEGSPIPTIDQPPGSQNPVPASSTTLTGLLKRDREGRWQPTAASTNDAIESTLAAITAMAPVAWSYPSNPPGTQAQYQAAEGQLFTLIQDLFCKTQSPTCSTVPGIRVNYSNPDLLDGLEEAQNIQHLHCGDSSYTDIVPPGAIYTGEQLTALREQICLEMEQLEFVHDNLFKPLRDDVYGQLKTDETLDLLSEAFTFLGFLKDEQDKLLSDRGKFLGISGEAGDILASLVEGGVAIAEYALAPETGGGSILAGNITADTLSLAGDSLGLASEAVDGNGAGAQITIGTLAGYVQKAYGYAQARTNEIESLVMTDPTKLAAVRAKVRHGEWDLAQSLSSGSTHTVADGVRFQHLVAARQYMLPRLLSADSKACDTSGSAEDPTTYLALTQLHEWVSTMYPQPVYLTYRTHRLRSVQLTSADAKQLGPALFASPFSGSGDPIADGPAGAAISRSPFFMLQVAQTTTSSSSDCTENFHN